VELEVADAPWTLTGWCPSAKLLMPCESHLRQLSFLKI